MTHKITVASLVFFTFITIISSQLVEEKTHLTSPRDGIASIQVDDKIYFVGGYELDDLIPSDAIDVYNTRTNSWENPLKLPTARGLVSPVSYGQNIFFVGGFYAENCIRMFNRTLHDFEWLDCGPTVRTAKQLSLHNDKLTVLGQFSADFYDVNSLTWNYSVPLTARMRSVVGGITLVHEDLVIGIGGVDRTNLDPVYDAWIFNTTTESMTIFHNVTSARIVTVDFKFTVAQKILAVWSVDTCFLHQFGGSQWFKVVIQNALGVATLGHETFIVNSEGFALFDWNTKSSKWMENDGILGVVAPDNQIALITRSKLAIYDGLSWTNISMSAPLTLSTPFYGRYLFSDGSLPFIYEPADKTLTPLHQTPLQVDITAMLSVDDQTFVTFSLVNFFVYRNSTLVFSSTSAAFNGQAVIGRDIIDFDSRRVIVNLTTIIPFQNQSTSNVWTSDGSFLMSDPQQLYYQHIDTYNYVTGEWHISAPLNAIRQFPTRQMMPAVAFPDTVVLFQRSQLVVYNVTTNTTSVPITVQPSPIKWPTFANIPQIDGAGYLLVTSTRFLRLTANNGISVATDQLPAGSPYQTLYDGNVMYVSLSSGLSLGDYFVVISYDPPYGNSKKAFYLPERQSRLLFAVSNDMLLTFASDTLTYTSTRGEPSWKSIPYNMAYDRSVIRTLPDSTVVMAGGKHAIIGHFTDEVIFMNTTGLLSTLITTPQSNGTDGQTGLTTGELVAAIVVPVGCAIIAGIILAVVLTKRNTRRKKSNESQTIGLAAKYGDWFTPFDQLVFGEQLGQGGSGQVFKGKWKNTTVALKVSMTQANSSVIGELELMMQMRPHPNVVQLFGFSVHPETDSIVLIIEYCNGGSLRTTLLDTKVEISSEQQRQWILGVAKGLSHLHSHNIVHRDVAARNILLSHNEPKVTDFGMSRLVEEQNLHGTTQSELGPIRWMSPESLRSKQYSSKSDVWSFGILMYEVFVRQEPHTEHDPIEVGLKIRDAGLTPVIPSECPTKFSNVMRECWNVSPESRPDMESIVKALDVPS